MNEREGCSSLLPFRMPKLSSEESALSGQIMSQRSVTSLSGICIMERNAEKGVWEGAGLGKVFQASFRGRHRMGSSLVECRDGWQL